MKKFLLVLALIAVVASADLNQELNAIFEEIKLKGVDWNQVWSIVKRVGCAAAGPVCCAAFPAACGVCNGIIAGLC